MKTKYKFIYFVHNGDQWVCRNSKSKFLLAKIIYYRPFKQWSVVSFDSDAVFSADCLADIIDFLGQLKAANWPLKGGD